MSAQRRNVQRQFNYNRVQMKRMDDGRWGIVLDGTEEDSKTIRARLSAALVPWEDDSDDLSLTLYNPTVAQMCTARQIVSDLSKQRLRPERF